MPFKGWNKVEINTRKGVISGIAPIIISASRSTDIPAFHGEWLMNRLQAGYIKWINPFNQKAQYVSFAKTRVIVFWTKNPRPMLSQLPGIDQQGLHYYFTFTLNDYEKEGFEPAIPSLADRINTFKGLADKIGRERVIWRFDPLILTDKLDVDELLNRIHSVAIKLNGHTNKLVISFVDLNSYGNVRRNLKLAGYQCKEFDLADSYRIASGLQKIGRECNLAIATCRESLALQEYGIVKNKCVDDHLMRQLFKRDSKLMEFLGAGIREVALFGEQSNVNDLKDKGQRENCRCIVSKDIGQYNTCLHFCRYCYANFSERTVKNNFLKPGDKFSESIISKEINE
jgi:hypothetical protein